MRFGFAVPTGTEGLMYPVPYASPEDAVSMAEGAERLGFESVWANDHVSTQRYVREKFASPPRYYDPLGYLAFTAARTERVRLGTALLVLPFRHPVVVAKQIATLDHLSGGRVVLGVGIGAYREEFESMWPNRRIHRGEYVQESLEALGLLFNERRVTYKGKYIQLADVESYPKPLQAPLPILSGGNSSGSKRRAGIYAQGWFPSCLLPEEIAAGIDEIERAAEGVGRTLPADFEIAPQLCVALGRTREDAQRTFEESQMYSHMRSLSASTLSGQQAGIHERNLVGTLEDIGEKISAYRDAGVTTLPGLTFACDNVPATLEMMEEFAETVIAAYPDGRE